MARPKHNNEPIPPDPKRKERVWEETKRKINDPNSPNRDKRDD